MKEMRKRLNQAIIEIAIITVSILLAFALERWWDNQVDRRSRDELASSLLLDFEATAVELQSALTIHRNRYLGASKLSELEEATIGNVSPDDLSQYWYWAVTPDETYPPTGALQSAINDNRLSLLSNATLKSRLASWQDRLENFRQTERVLAEYTLQTFWPNVAVDVIIPLNKEAIGRETDKVILLPATKNHLNLLSLGSQVAIGQIETLHEEVIEILRLLHEEAEGI
jgi:hypothetical protein